MKPTHQVSSYRLALPLTEVWNAEFSRQQIDLVPAVDRDLVAVATESTLSALRLDDGAHVWSVPLGARPTNLSATPFGFAVSHADGNSSVIVMYDHGGAKLWEFRQDWGLGHSSLRSHGDLLIGLGYSVSRGNAICVVIHSRDGRVEKSFECPGDLPDIAPSGYVYSVRSSDPAISGLFLNTPRGLDRLIPNPHWIRTVSGDMAFIDTYDRGQEDSELYAINLATREVAWTARGGPNFRIAADFNHVAAVEMLTPETLSLVLRNAGDGSEVWRTPPIKGRSAAALMAESFIALYIESQRIDVFDRTNGNLVQSIQRNSRFSSGGLLTASGLIDSFGGRVWCLRGSDQ